MKITVLTPTYQFLYRDRQLKALEEQTFKDFEWIIVDDAYEKNKGISAPFPLLHMSPSQPVPYVALAAAMNDGIVRARGKYIFFMNDYIVPSPTCLERHWEIQERTTGCLLSGQSLNMDNPPSSCYDKDNNLITRDYRMGLFDGGYFTREFMEDDLFETKRDGIQNWWAGRNDSAPLNTILECNGFDEVFDGRWGGHDADMANRLMTFGLRYILDRNEKNLCYEYDHPRGNKKQCRTEEEQQSLQYRIINPKVERGIYIANNQWFVMLPRDLKGERDEKRIC